MRANRNRGFTLIELMILLLLIGIVAVIAVPGFRSLVEGHRISSLSNSLIGTLNYARSEAIRRGATIAVVPTGGSYADGVTVQTNSAPVETLRQAEGPGGGVTLVMSSGAAMTFRANGMTGQANSVQYRVCGGGGENGTEVTVSPGGIVRSAQIVCP
ncbi:GspH/FimT family pseudopilin [Marinobacter mangrovi]|uniref:GspH/FimT family pseudopilin n=1 Tax=Marinobacter mangrovi TaxID=2803918 RepID=UPI001934B181|nr:GspH/FimT family pseudopilin [Marinobacter mangrovi]